MTDNDVKELAETIIYFWQTYDDSDYGANGYQCEFCQGKHTYDVKEFKHELDCVVLIAQDILTIGKKEKIEPPPPPGHIKEFNCWRGWVETEASIQANIEWNKQLNS